MTNKQGYIFITVCSVTCTMSGPQLAMNHSAEEGPQRGKINRGTAGQKT